MLDNELEAMRKAIDAERDRAHAVADQEHAKAMQAWNLLWEKFNGLYGPSAKTDVRPEPTGPVREPPSVSRAVRVAAHMLGANFTTQHIIDFIDKNFPGLEASGKRTQISSVLSKLVDGDLVHVVQQGRPGTSNTYSYGPKPSSNGHAAGPERETLKMGPRVR